MDSKWLETKEGEFVKPSHIIARQNDYLEEETVRKSRTDPDLFVNYVLGWNAPDSGPNKWYPPMEIGIDPSDSSIKIPITCVMHRRWQDLISKHPKTYIEAPREHSKTTRVTIGRTIWEIGKNQNLRIKVVCQNDEKSAEVVTAISQHILTNPRVRKVFPDLEPDTFGQWARHKIYVKRTVISRDASVEASGILATGVGGRADLLVFDDPVDYKNAIQFPALREQVKQAYYEVWLNLLPAYGGRVIYICTPWHQDDLSMDIKSNHPEYEMCSNPIDENMTPVWPDKWDKGALETRRQDIGIRGYDRGFRLRPLSDEDILFREEAIEKCSLHEIGLGELPGDNNPRKWKYYTGVDLGIGKKSSTLTSIFTFGVRKGYPHIPVEIKAGKFGEIEKIKQVAETFERWQPEILVVENNSYQETFLSWIKEMQLKIPVRGLYTGSQKIDLSFGLPSLAVEMENIMWGIPLKGHEKGKAGEMWTGRKAKECTCPVCKWMDQCRSYPLGLTDILMSWWIAREGFRSLQVMGGPRIRVLESASPKRRRGLRVDTDDD